MQINSNFIRKTEFNVLHLYVESLTIKSFSIMNREQILTTFFRLSISKGFYGSIYEKLTDGSEQSEDYLDFLESQNFKSISDLVLFVEC